MPSATWGHRPVDDGRECEHVANAGGGARVAVARERLPRHPDAASTSANAHHDEGHAGDAAENVVAEDGPLSPKELAVLEYLLAAQGRVVSAEELLERVWDEAADPFTTTVKVTIHRLRTKLGDPPLIETLPRTGYRI